ncbi:hypothetical protein QBC46DRAFT_139118 [Diplogelasinospora grovesii]|uniref:Uncharacterized protein n=1 Tax=Diplogelasinospora grovesii TaxID=303347 RepID=A0AAN6N619_9PEZI|nr:hypothetical protein QBC46DRAFT_139118 [Diplogelasinospora grovesii]
MSSAPRRQSSSQTSSSRDSRSRRSNDSYASHSTTPTSLYTSPHPSDVKTCSSGSYAYSNNDSKVQKGYTYQDDVSPNTSLYPRSSVDSYASTTASSEDLDAMDLDESPMDYEYTNIPPLPEYRREVVEPNVRASTPQDFAKLFPSLNRLTIRHDEFTPDGNMNLRVDTVVTGRRRTAIQLFHLRMYDLAKREFSLRRYCRDSGREVCNSKRKYTEPGAKLQADGRPKLQRSMSTALKTFGARPVFRRASSGSTARPDTSYSSSDGDDELFNDKSNLSRLSLDSRTGKAKSQRPMPTNTIKLEFSNYARVDVHRRGGKSNKRYEFEWWGHRYNWKRSVDKQMGLVSFHLVRDGNTGAPVAHIVPETRSPSQVLADENAGGWVPPCFMWIADETIVDAVTDVADVIMATGLMALVDDCIKERWQTKKVHRIPVPLTSKTVNLESYSPKSFMQHVFGRRHSNDHHSNPPSPLRFANPISAY